MVRHAAAVMRGAAETALVIGDLPFLTYASEADAIDLRPAADAGGGGARGEAGGWRSRWPPTSAG